MESNARKQDSDTRFRLSIRILILNLFPFFMLFWCIRALIKHGQSHDWYFYLILYGIAISTSAIIWEIYMISQKGLDWVNLKLIQNELSPDNARNDRRKMALVVLALMAAFFIINLAYYLFHR